jgi:hypothetical protein
MSQTPIPKPVCSKCGSEALGPALFCYHCGSRLGVDEVQEKELSEIDRAGEDRVDVPIEPPSGDPFEDAAAEDDEKPQAAKANEKSLKPEIDPGMTTASALRKNPEVLRMRRVEVRWTPDEGSPNVWFIIAALTLSLSFLGIFLLSMYLR